MNMKEIKQDTSGHTTFEVELDGRKHYVKVWLIVGGSPAISMTDSDGIEFYSTQRFEENKYTAEEYFTMYPSLVEDYINENWKARIAHRMFESVFNAFSWKSRRIHDKENHTYFHFRIRGYYGVSNDNEYGRVVISQYQHTLGSQLFATLTDLRRLHRSVRYNNTTPTMVDIYEVLQYKKELSYDDGYYGDNDFSVAINGKKYKFDLNWLQLEPFEVADELKELS